MSGFVGIINFGGDPVDARLLDSLTSSLSFRGPDARGTLVRGHVGLGHTLLRCGDDAPSEQQPFSLDDEVWIVADVRLDRRGDLLRDLELHERERTAPAPDAELLLRAYLAWGEDCVDHLLGDFSFALWDGRRQRLFGARDQFGLKLFYYARMGNTLLFSNTLDCLRLHPAVTGDLNDRAIGDFLLFGCNMDIETTTFADIMRLPPATAARWSKEGFVRRRYWELQGFDPVRYRRREQYGEHFGELLETAVRDRLPRGPAALWMSGGLDSTSIAATASRLREETGVQSGLKAFTVVYDHLLPDDERQYAGLAAGALKIPIQYLPADGYTLFQGWDRPELRTPEPLDNALSAIDFDFARETSLHSRTVLYGQGGDEVLDQPSLVESIRDMGFPRVLREVLPLFLAGKSCPHPGTGIVARLKALFKGERQDPSYPRWINPDFASSLDLPGRWETMSREMTPPVSVRRPRAWRRLVTPLWQSFAESCDAGWMGVALEVRHPYLDLRLMRFLLSVPPLPWFVDKEILRRAMVGRLPEPVRRRRKTPLGHLVYAHLKNARWTGKKNFMPVEEMERFVSWKAVPVLKGAPLTPDEAEMSLRPLSLNYWLYCIRRSCTI